MLYLGCKAAARLTTQAILIQPRPIVIRIVNRDLAAGRHATRNDDDPLLSPPEEFLELAVRAARMVDEAREVAHVALVDLVAMLRGPADHDVQAFNAAGNQSDEFGNGRASIEVLGLSAGVKLGRMG